MKPKVTPAVRAPATFRCWIHEDQMLVDEASAPGSLCPQCDELELVDVVRGLYRKKRG